MDISSGKRWRTEEKISRLRESKLFRTLPVLESSSRTFMRRLQDNLLLPKGFTEYIYHVGNVSEIHSIIGSGLIPGGQSLKRGRQVPSGIPRTFRTCAVSPALQDNERKDLPSLSTTSGNGNGVNSTMGNGLIPGGRSLKRGRQALFFTTMNPMDDEFGMEETSRDLTKPRIAPYKITWKRLQQEFSETPSNYAISVQFEGRKKSLRIYQTWS